MQYRHPMTACDLETPSIWSGTVRVSQGTTLLEEVSAGFAADPDGPSCSPRLRYQAGSISKLVVSIVVLSLVEQGELDLDDPISRCIPTPPQWREITLHQLLSQTSGIGHWNDIPSLPPTFLAAPPRRDDLAGMIADAPLIHDPGETWSYSGPGFLVAALVTEAATGTDYGDIAAELVFRRAGLTATSSGRFPTEPNDTARGHQHGKLSAVPEGFTDIPGTGDLWTTVDDLATLNQALRSGTVLAADTAALLWTPHVSIHGSGDTAPVVSGAYGYGTFLGQVKGHRARIHPGDNPGYQSLLAYLPDSDLDLVVLCNEGAPSVSAALDSIQTI